jgi:hypothetical protein
LRHVIALALFACSRPPAPLRETAPEAAPVHVPAPARAFECDRDHANVLTRDAGFLAVVSACRGEGGCVEGDGGVTCDDSWARADDPCDTEEQIACSEDGTLELRCAGARFVKARECRKPCEATSETIVCD